MISLFPQYSMKNRHLVEQSTEAGCYHCCKIFEVKEVKEYTDGGKTCICPHCGVDSIVGNMCGFSLTPEVLTAAHQFWFGD